MHRQRSRCSRASSALTSFAVARTLSAVLSLAEGTAVQAAPFGVGLELTPGRILQPLNELSEQFSSLMLAASVAFGVQLFLLKIGATWLISALLSAALLLWLAMRLVEADPASRSSRFASTALLALLLVRFAVPLSALASEAVFRNVLAEPHQEALAAVELSGRQLEGAQSDGEKKLGDDKIAAGASSKSPQPAPDASSSATGISSLWDALKQKLPAVPHPSAVLQRMRDAADRVVDQIVRLIAIYVVQTLVLPLAFLWILVSLGRSLLSGRGWRLQRS